MLARLGKIIVFLAASAGAAGLGTAWIPLFDLIVQDEAFRGAWILTLVLTVAVLFMASQHLRLGIGRAMAFCCGIGLIGSLILLSVGQMQNLPLVLVMTAGSGLLAWNGLRFTVKADPHALQSLSAENPHLKDFSAYYESSLQPWMMGQEIRRKKAVRRMWIGLCFAIPAATLLNGLLDYYLLPEGSDFWGWVQFGAYAILMIAGGALSASPYFDLQEDIKGQLLDRLGRYFGGLRYIPHNDKFDPKPYHDAGLVKMYNRQNAGEAFAGVHSGVDFIIAEQNLTLVTGHGKNRTTTTIFDGLMIVLTLPQPFKGHTLVLTNKGAIGNKLDDRKKPGSRVDLVYSSFEDLFEVYSTDQIEAREVLTPDMMQNLITMGELFQGRHRKKTRVRDEKTIPGGAFEAAILGNLLLITIRTPSNLFEIGHLDAGMADTARIASFAREVGLIYEIIDTLELHRKTRRSNTVS